MHAISSYRGNRPTNKQTQPQTHPQTGPITIHCAIKLSVQCNKKTKNNYNDSLISSRNELNQFIWASNHQGSAEAHRLECWTFNQWTWVQTLLSYM